jgi:anti-anti-sigma factor
MATPLCSAAITTAPTRRGEETPPQHQRTALALAHSAPQTSTLWCPADFGRIDIQRATSRKQQGDTMIAVHSCALPGAVIRVSVAGEIDMATVNQLDVALTTAIGRDDATGVEIDFAGVTFCDSSGIAALDRAYGMATQRSLPLRLINIQPDVAQVLAIVGMLEVLTGETKP